jgi:hypothetical protein
VRAGGKIYFCNTYQEAISLHLRDIKKAIQNLPINVYYNTVGTGCARGVSSLCSARAKK